MLQLIAIKTKDKVYISSNINNQYSYGKCHLLSYMFDGEYPKETYKNDWVEICKIPTKIEIIVKGNRINTRYELKEGFPITDNTPTVLPYYYDSERDTGFPEEYEEYEPLYEFKYDMSEDEIKEVSFELNIIAEEDEFKIIKEEFKVKYNLLDELNTHPVMLSARPCKLSSEESYKIIREHIKRNINRNYAIISSDYDFCMTIQKVIKTEGRYEEFYYPFRKGKKSEKRYVSDRQVVVFETAPDRGRDGVYKGYTRTKEFEGRSYEDLCNNIQIYLANLMKEINKPLIDCPHCKGFGVILEENKYDK